jgi:4-diphosphocytidyl-2-C-methyl-D-erythritol kinase
MKSYSGQKCPQIVMRFYMVSVKEYAYAKINLYLDVVNKREDGFHDIRTVMHTISLCDDITVTVKPSSLTSVRLSVLGHPKLPTDSRNLAVRAAELFLSATLISAEVNIRLVKRIPVAAGLAGGSTDAAAVLRAMNKAFKRPLTEKRLLELAAQLGSDVPYCLVGGTALCYGRGEKIDRLPEKLSLHLALAVEDEYVSTPQAYAELDVMYNDFKDERDSAHDRALTSVLESIATGDATSIELYNIFENAVFKTCFKAESIKEQMITLGANHALMSGSGPSVFGIFADEFAARAAVEKLRKTGVRAYYAESVARK